MGKKIFFFLIFAEILYMYNKQKKTANQIHKFNKPKLWAYAYVNHFDKLTLFVF